MPLQAYPLAGMAFDYLIEKDNAPGIANRITELGYDAKKPPTLGIGVKYVNLRDEEDTNSFGPYLEIADDILAEYHEPAPDPTGDGFWRNLNEQLKRAVEQGFIYVELDNLDTYDVDVALKCFDELAKNDLLVLAKNPLKVRGSNTALLAHAAVVGCIVEEGCGTPPEMDELRRKVGKRGSRHDTDRSMGSGRPFHLVLQWCMNSLGSRQPSWLNSTKVWPSRHARRKTVSVPTLLGRTEVAPLHEAWVGVEHLQAVAPELKGAAFRGVDHGFRRTTSCGYPRRWSGLRRRAWARRR
jgi:hypothetical protein